MGRVVTGGGVRRVWVTRDEGEGAPGGLCAALTRHGLTPVLRPVVSTRVLGDAKDEIERLGADDWLVLTSPRAIELVSGPAARLPRVAVVGTSSAKLARSLGMRVDLVSPTGSAVGLARALAPLAEGRCVCHPRSQLAEPVRPAGAAAVESPAIYTTEARAFDASVVDRVDIASFASPSAVRAALDALRSLPVPAAAIGATTSAALRERGVEPVVVGGEASPSTFDGLAEAIVEGAA